MHFAAQVRPFMQSPLSAHAVVCSLHDLAKHCGSISSGLSWPCASSANSFSASAGSAPARSAAEARRGAASCTRGAQLLGPAAPYESCGRGSAGLPAQPLEAPTIDKLAASCSRPDPQAADSRMPDRM
eukprot:scaffold14954_cov122-Isochrysis_galbana.AAC.4